MICEILMFPVLFPFSINLFCHTFLFHSVDTLSLC